MNPCSDRRDGRVVTGRCAGSLTVAGEPPGALIRRRRNKPVRASPPVELPPVSTRRVTRANAAAPR